jgi:hypothetical protein
MIAVSINIRLLWSQRVGCVASHRGATVFLAPLRGADDDSLLSGGLRYAATTGYYLTALQAEKSNLLRPDRSAYCLLPTAYCPLPTAYCPLPTAFRFPLSVFPKA